MIIKPLFSLNLFRDKYSLFKWKKDGIHLTYRYMDINLLELFYEDEEALWSILDNLSDGELSLSQRDDLKDVIQEFYKIKFKDE
jgi:hypothetical protein